MNGGSEGSVSVYCSPALDGILLKGAKGTFGNAGMETCGMSRKAWGCKASESPVRETCGKHHSAQAESNPEVGTSCDTGETRVYEEERGACGIQGERWACGIQGRKVAGEETKVCGTQEKGVCAEGTGVDSLHEGSRVGNHQEGTRAWVPSQVTEVHRHREETGT